MNFAYETLEKSYNNIEQKLEPVQKIIQGKNKKNLKTALLNKLTNNIQRFFTSTSKEVQERVRQEDCACGR